MQIRARTRMPARCSAFGIVKSKKWVRGLDIMFYGRESISLRVALQARPTPFLCSGGTMRSSRRHLLLLSFAALPGVLVRFQDPVMQDPTRGRRRPDGSEDASNNPNSPNLPPPTNNALPQHPQQTIKKNFQ